MNFLLDFRPQITTFNVIKGLFLFHLTYKKNVPFNCLLSQVIGSQRVATIYIDHLMIF